MKLACRRMLNHEWLSVSQGGYHNPADMPLQNPKDQITMWQQGNYMADSGIHSGVTTRAPSQSGKDEEMDTNAGEWMDGQGQNFSQGGYTSEQVRYHILKYLPSSFVTLSALNMLRNHYQIFDVRNSRKIKWYHSEC